VFILFYPSRLEAARAEPVDDAILPVWARSLYDETAGVLLDAHAGGNGVSGVE